MPKKGQHHRDINDPAVSRVHNNPRKSMTITTGTYKKHETYEKQALAHEDPAKPAQAAKNVWIRDTRDPRRLTNKTRARQSDLRSGRSGSDSNASGRTRGH